MNELKNLSASRRKPFLIQNVSRKLEVSADSHVAISDDKVKQHLHSRLHRAWDEGMAKYDAVRSEQMAGGSLELEDFVDPQDLAKALFAARMGVGRLL